MAWFTRITRFGDVHLVYGQEANMSCGIASVMMCVFKINKLKPGATAMTVEKDICQKYADASGTPYAPNKKGTLPKHLAHVLNEFTSGHWRWHHFHPNHVPSVLVHKVGVASGLGPTVDVNPVILGVDWETHGAHWVVVDTVREFLGTKYATVCDPWDSNVHIQKIREHHPFHYNANEGGFSFDFWGSHKEYTNSAKGQVKTWGMLYRDSAK